MSSLLKTYNCELESHSWSGVLDTTCDKVCQRLAACRWFSSGIPVSFGNKTDLPNKAKILLKVALSTTHPFRYNLFQS